MTKYINFMPHFGAAIATGVKTLTFRKASKYEHLRPGDIVHLRLDKAGGYIVGPARITDVRVGSLHLRDCAGAFPGSVPRLGLYWKTEYKWLAITLDEIMADGFHDPVQFIWAHHALGNFSTNPDRPVTLRCISFQLEDPAQAAADYAAYEAKLSTSPHPVLF